MPWIIPAIIVSYLIGSIPTAYIFGRLFKGVDIRKFGSGNVGATNALRLLGKKAGFSVLFLDILKGFIAVVFLGDFVLLKAAPLTNEVVRIILGLSCICGHIWTVFLKFQGGKGIATSIGVLLGLAVRIPGLKIVFALLLLSWAIVFISTKIISLASIIAMSSLPILMLIFRQPSSLIFSSFILSALVIFRHKSNLKRLFRREEPRLNFKKS